MKVYPVVHVNSVEQSVEQAAIASEAGADGVFLIEHGLSTGPYDRLTTLLMSFNEVSKAFPDMEVGINYLSMDPLEGYRFTQDALDTGRINKAPNALWFDDAISGASTVGMAKKYLERVRQYREDNPDMKKVRMFGGVSFKYTLSYTSSSATSAKLASEFAPYIDVVTTSGAGTGKAPSPEKIAAMKKAVGIGRLAVASGIDADNLASYMGEIDDILISSSLETKPYSGIFVPEKVKSFVAAAHN